MAVLRGMFTIQYLARSARSYIIYCLSPFRHVAVLTFAILVYRRFYRTMMSSGHAHYDRQRYNMACPVTREWASDVTENLRRFLVRSIQARGKTPN